ncbi:efflux transporter outer membrane subunit [Acidisphaera rubrifaciens]|uniref:Secretion system type I outer membrane efflux pump lipoprotein NodT n=1 Tax=Acidisphaera rubrifaciens HS-AP3 TaxID=1231350 RepID=A0A0D6P9R0_9PROT|nr:efflux transporter outer membrane subunit [Acidisphaera rubrifaciens]GAN78392.1 secretion system type I outer membrane efflux pump lipoprotein NodT [Acidisphaera rubrifaciens HS-AP3]
MRHARLIALALPGPLLVAGCEVGPDYKKPPAPMAAHFKELAGWKPASPLDAVPRGPWWSVYHDPLLDRLEGELIVDNQTIRQAEAAYRQAQALVDEARSNLYPVLGLNPTFTRSGGGAGSGSIGGGTTTTAVGGGSSTSSTFVSGGRGGGYAASVYTFEGSATWSPDVWGRVRRQIESSVAGAQVSAADLASAALAQQTLLATDYFEMRTSDALQKLLDRTVADYQHSLQITQNQYAVGVAARSDVVTAETLLRTTQSQAINVGVARQQYEHAIAVLIGHPPADLTIPAGDLASEVPVAPAGVPSRLLERRPDIAAAERTMAEENALIGVAVAAFYPDITLSALGGFVGNPLGSLFTASNRIWSLGAAASQTVFDAGLRESTVRAARATYDEAVAAYRQTVLTAFQQVEDDLSGLRILQDQQRVQEDAVRLAREAVRISLNEYSAGTVAYTAVITAQATALADEETLLSIRQSRIVTSVSLIQALGGGWNTADLPDRADLTQRNLLDPRNNY